MEKQKPSETKIIDNGASTIDNENQSPPLDASLSRNDLPGDVNDEFLKRLRKILIAQRAWPS